MTVTLCILVPVALVAVSVYVVVTAGDTFLVSAGATGPMPLSMNTAVASLTFQLRVVDAPSRMAAGDAVKEFIVGNPADVLPTTICVVAVIEPVALVAVIV